MVSEVTQVNGHYIVYLTVKGMPNI